MEGQLDSNPLARIPLKAVVIIHFVLTIWASQSGFLPVAYLFMNISIVFCGMWAIAQAESPDSIQMYLFLHVISIVMDIIFLSIFFDTGPNKSSSSVKFSKTMSIINLLVKPLTSFIMLIHFRNRGGQYSSSYPSPSASGYENVDQPLPSNSQVEAANSPTSFQKPYIPQ